MKPIFHVILLLVLSALPARASEGEPDILDFFREEAEAIQVVTASRLPQSLRWTPATVHVVTQEDIRLSGARTIWDALRGVPGVDVMSTRAFYGEVSIRGLNRALSSRTLVLLDGRAVLDGPFDSVNWEGIPVSLEEVARIEVVEGPASALYGANAISGVIQIITRPPVHPKEGSLALSLGERRTRLGSVVWSGRDGRALYSGGLSLRRSNRFEDGGLRAMAGGKAHARLGFDLSPDIRLGLSGGIVVHENQFTTGSTGTGLYDGGNGYIEASYQDRRHRIRAFWDRVKATYDEFRITPSPDARFGSFEGHAERVFNLSFGGSLALGGSYRRDSARSRIYSPSKIAQHLWAGFFEGAWRLSDRARLTVSGRGDRHPITGWVFSPRGSLVYSTNPNHALRLSAGTSFKNPAMTESHLSLTQNFGSYMGVPVIVTLLGSRDLKAERITQVETAYRGQLGRVRALATVFHYRLSNIIANHENRVDLVFGPPARVDVTIPYVNAAEGIRSWGGEVGLQIPIRRTFRVTGNYSYQRLRGFAISGNRGPAHKVNAGVSGGSGGLSAGVWLHWVGSTTWTNPNLITLRSENTRLTGYLLSNVHLGYAPGGPLKGFQLSLDAFNLMNHIHHEILPSFPAGGYGQNGEIIRRRLTGTVSWSF